MLTRAQSSTSKIGFNRPHVLGLLCERSRKNQVHKSRVASDAIKYSILENGRTIALAEGMHNSWVCGITANSCDATKTLTLKKAELFQKQSC